ncbi:MULTISPECIES: CopG family ribbon-helix-helix protein [Haloprofundus]|uniref:CopG family ribbon-helix-helix protein n=1 Tax=Haloprofundus TaxID=1911573 RepID=UPI000E4430C4|nr:MULTISPECIES: ribbon-helix-helix domain-containing protein [Haloprofundus]QCJ45849.1 ribbon-helix-helix protein, CopG family [Haloprofundus sp. MHR1]
MSRVEVTLPDDLSDRIDRLVEQGEFLNRQAAMEELLSMGVSTYDTTDEPGEELDDELFNQKVEEQQDPALRDNVEGDGSPY